jgi:hypothetical protein
MEDIVQSHNRDFTMEDPQELERLIEHGSGGRNNINMIPHSPLGSNIF